MSEQQPEATPDEEVAEDAGLVEPGAVPADDEDDDEV